MMISAFPKTSTEKHRPNCVQYIFPPTQLAPASKSAQPASKALELKATMEGKNPCAPSLPTVLHAKISKVKTADPKWHQLTTVKIRRSDRVRQYANVLRIAGS